MGLKKNGWFFSGRFFTTTLLRNNLYTKECRKAKLSFVDELKKLNSVVGNPTSLCQVKKDATKLAGIPFQVLTKMR